MAGKRLTEKEQVAAVKSNASFVISQQEAQDGGGTTESIRRAQLSVIVAALRNNGVLNGVVTTEQLAAVLQEYVVGVEATADGLSVAYGDGTAEEIVIENGLDFDRWYMDSDGYLHLTKDGEDVIDPAFIGGGGGGGGGGGNNAVFKAKNTSGWTKKDIAKDTECVVTLEWSSLEDDISTGDGGLTVVVNNTTVLDTNVAQGEISVDMVPFLVQGKNEIKITIADVYSNKSVFHLTVNMSNIFIESQFDPSTAITGPLVMTYTPTGATQKLVHFEVDGNTVGTALVSVSGKQQSYIIPAQTHGAHELKVYFTTEINGQTVRSNTLRYDVIWLEESNINPVVSASCEQSSVSQYSTVAIAYKVYTPGSLVSPVRITVNGDVVVDAPSVDRVPKSYSHRCMEPGDVTVVISSGTASRTVSFTVTELDVDVHAETEGLELCLMTSGRSNIEAHPEIWTDGTNTVELTDLNFVSDGWHPDSTYGVSMRLIGDARAHVDFKPFIGDFRTTGKTIEFEFSTHSVMDYDATVISCMSGRRGLKVTANEAVFISEQSLVRMQFKEDEHVRIGFVVEKRSENRLIYCYLNGVLSGIVQYPSDDDFAQAIPTGIDFGNNDCGIDIYGVRVYNHNLNREQMLNNWIADMQNGEMLLAAYTRNQIYDEYGNVSIAKLPSNLPYLILRCPVLPQYKGDKKICEGEYVDPLHPERSFTFTRAEIDVQGTSSQYYWRKNYKVKFRGGFVMANGQTVSTITIGDGEIGVNVICFKADVASSEGANNVVLAKLWDDACPYKTPAQQADSRVRQAIDGRPIVIFHNDGSSSDNLFLGKYNMNVDKSCADYFGFKEGDESWEVKNNTSNRVIYKSADYEGDAWLNDFEARFPDTDPAYIDPTQLREFAEWVASTDTEAATGDDLDSPVTYGTGDDAVTYTTDSADYRLAKFRYELDDYVEADSAFFYYLYTHLNQMVDSRAKNMFPSFIGGDIA